MYIRKEIRERLHLAGLIRARAVPFDSEEEWRYWWLPEIVNGKIVRPARMSEREKEKYTVAQAHNILTSNGISAILGYIGSASGSTEQFAQYFAIGDIAINSVSAGDTSLAGEIFRAAPSLSNITGVQIDLSTFIGSTQANANWTNVGLFGNGATGTIGSGTLMTHSLFTYTKVSGTPVTVDYLITQN